MKGYKTEIWVTVVCLILVCIAGGFLSLFFAIQPHTNLLFTQQPMMSEWVQQLGDTNYLFREDLTVLGFPLHYFLLIMLSWIGATLIGAIWCLVMDKLEERQRRKSL